jgi:uncharacterized protein (DUF2267 family)
MADEPLSRRQLNARFIRDTMRAQGLSYQQAARLLRTNIHTLRGWMKPRSAHAAPDMAVELICLKTGTPLPPWLDRPMTPIADMLRVVRREIALREKVYPRQLELGRMKRAEAEFQLDAMKDVARLLELIEANEELAAAIDRALAR